MSIAQRHGICAYCGHDHDQILFHTTDRDEVERLKAELSYTKASEKEAMRCTDHWKAQAEFLTQQLAEYKRQLAEALERIEYLKYYGEDA